MTAPRLSPWPAGQPGPKVSVIMPTYNRAKSLEETARMVLNQSLDDLELWIIDDQSTDRTPEIALELIAIDRRVRYHRLAEHSGVTLALNSGISRSTGAYIQVCHDHDIYLESMLEKMARVLDENPGVVFVHPGRQGCDSAGNPLQQAYFVCGYPEVSSGGMWKKKMLTRLASPVTALCMIRRLALEKTGLLDPEFGACSDVELWLRLCEIGDVGYVNELLLYIRGRDPSHPYYGVNWDIQDQVIRAHRMHLRRQYHGLQYAWWKLRREAEIDLSLTIDYLNSIRRKRWNDVRLGRAYLRSHGNLLSKTLSVLL